MHIFYEYIWKPVYALMSLMFGKEMRFQVPPKTFRLDGWITQRIRQCVPNRHTGDCKSTATKPRNIQFAMADRTVNGDRKLRRLARSSRRGTL